ncbi:biotin--protein ligase, partial [Aeromicrobium phragmitis]
MHGEFKVPNGKLVVADVDVRDGVLTDIRLSGDFFLEPEDALGRMSDALDGLPADAPATTFEQAI